MLEAVGAAHLETYFAGIDRLLKRNGGVAVFQCITIPACARSDDFIRHYILPGGHLPAVARRPRHRHVENIGPTTSRRCDCGAGRSCASSTWRSGRRCGMWRFSGGSGSCYFAYSEAGFARRCCGYCGEGGRGGVGGGCAVVI